MRSGRNGYTGIEMDNNPFGCLTSPIMDRYGIPVIRGEFTGCLPFKDKSFRSISALFPHDDLLYFLCKNPALWKELHRIIIPGGGVRVITEVPENDIEWVSYKDHPVKLCGPQYEIGFLADENGFHTEITSLKPDQAESFGTFFSEWVAGEQREFQSFKVYQIIACK